MHSKSLELDDYNLDVSFSFRFSSSLSLYNKGASTSVVYWHLSPCLGLGSLGSNEVLFLGFVFLIRIVEWHNIQNRMIVSVQDQKINTKKNNVRKKYWKKKKLGNIKPLSKKLNLYLTKETYLIFYVFSHNFLYKGDIKYLFI